MPTVPLNSISDSIYTENEFVQFEVFDDVFLKKVEVRTQREGRRKFVVMENGEVVYEMEFDLSVGVNTIPLNISFTKGVYRLGTDSIVNFENLGTLHPQFSYSEVYVANDKAIQGYAEIMNSEFYPGITPYFFSWEFDYGFYYCEDRIPINAIIKIPVSTNEVKFNSIVYPNPTNGLVYIETDISEEFTIHVIDVAGNSVLTPIKGTSGRMSILLPETKGLYIIQLTNKVSSQYFKVYTY